MRLGCGAAGAGRTQAAGGTGSFLGAARAAQRVVRTPGGGDSVGTRQGACGGGEGRVLARAGGASQAESGSKVSAECCFWGAGGGLHAPLLFLHKVGTQENRRAFLANLASRHVCPAPTPLPRRLPPPRPVGTVLSEARPWPVAATTNLILLPRDFGSQPKWNRIGQLLQKLRGA